MSPAQEALWDDWTAWLRARGVHWRSATQEDAESFAVGRVEVLLALSLHYAEHGLWPPAFEARVCRGDSADEDEGAIRLASAMDVARRRWGDAAVIAGDGRAE